MFRQRFYSPAISDSAYAFQDKLEKALFFWETALLEKGSRNNYPKEINLISLPSPRNKSSWSEQYENKIKNASDEIIRYHEIKNEIASAKQATRRNLYSLLVMEQINELQIYPSKLLLLLDNYEKASSPDAKEKQKEEIATYVNSFEKTRKAYEEVLSQTRILSNPSDYVLDQNHHAHLANGTINNDWMFVYELAMNKRLVEWLNNK
jgi:hypothetical protein